MVIMKTTLTYFNWIKEMVIAIKCCLAITRAIKLIITTTEVNLIIAISIVVIIGIIVIAISSFITVIIKTIIIIATIIMLIVNFNVIKGLRSNYFILEDFMMVTFKNLEVIMDFKTINFH